MTRSIGRVSHIQPQLRWTWDPDARCYVELEESTPNELEKIGQQMQAIDREQAGLIQAVRYARARGFTWARIAVILGVSRQAAQQRFGDVDQKLSSEGTELPDDADPEPAAVEPASGPTVQPQSAPPPPTYDFSAMNAMSTEEIIDLANKLPKDPKLLDAYLLAQREAIVVTLYKRDMKQREIALLIGKSRQRAAQILAGYYDRIEKAWARERAEWQKGI